MKEKKNSKNPTNVKVTKEAEEYNKFKAKVARLTSYAHTRRMFARMEAKKVKEEEENRKSKKNAVVKTETTS